MGGNEIVHAIFNLKKKVLDVILLKFNRRIKNCAEIK